MYVVSFKSISGSKRDLPKADRESCQHWNITLFPLFAYKNLFSLFWEIIFFVILYHCHRIRDFLNFGSFWKHFLPLNNCYIYRCLMTQKLKKDQFCLFFVLMLMHIQFWSNNYFISCLFIYLLLDQPLHFVFTYFNSFLYSFLL